MTTAAPKIVVKYSCRGCGLVQRPVEVLARAPAEDLHAWLGYVQEAVGGDHARFRCASRVCDLMIPLPPGDGPFPLGGPVPKAS